MFNCCRKISTVSLLKGQKAVAAAPLSVSDTPNSIHLTGEACLLLWCLTILSELWYFRKFLTREEWVEALKMIVIVGDAVKCIINALGITHSH